MAGLLLSYPEIFLAISFFLLVFFYHQNRIKSLVPINWPILGMLPDLLANLHHVHDWITEVFKETGCTFRFRGPWFLSMDFIITCDPANVNHVFNVNFPNYPKGEEFSEIFDILGEGIFNANDDSWKMQRKKAHGVMTSPGFRAFIAEYSRDKVENGLVPLMSRLAERGAVFDLQDVFLRLTFDMTCSLVFGVDPGCLSPAFPTIPFARAVDDATEALFFRHTVPPLFWKLMRWLQIGKEKKLRLAWEAIDEFVAENIAKKKEEKHYSEDLLTSYVEADDPTDDRFLRDTAVNLMLAGRDTTGVALVWFFWLLSRHPEVKSKILEELEDPLREKTYLHAALSESLRLYPSVPFEHKAPLQEEVLPSGTRVESKEKILFSTYSMARLEGVWGKDCSEFRPERWISPRGTLRHEPSYKFLSFNCGPRTCLGKDIAFAQMKTVAASVICNFDIEILEGHVVEPKLSIILHMKNGLMVRVKKRIQTAKKENVK